MFDKNPKSTPADVFIAGKTTEQVVRAVVKAQQDLGQTPDPILAALVARFDRKTAAREARADAA